MSADRISVTRRISAPAAKIFAIVSSPAGHVEIDGSGMLEAAPDAEPMTAAGQTFDMDMDRTSLGDIPNLTKYKVRNTVTQVVPDRLFEWTIGMVDGAPLGHLYGWEISPVGDDACDVTNYCDWTNISDQLRSGREWPVVPQHMLEQSVANLERVATQG